MILIGFKLIGSSKTIWIRWIWIQTNDVIYNLNSIVNYKNYILFRSRLNGLKYACNQEVLDDIRLVFSNCFQVLIFSLTQIKCIYQTVTYLNSQTVIYIIQYTSQTIILISNCAAYLKL